MIINKYKIISLLVISIFILVILIFNFSYHKTNTEEVSIFGQKYNQLELLINKNLLVLGDNIFYIKNNNTKNKLAIYNTLQRSKKDILNQDYQRLSMEKIFDTNSNIVLIDDNYKSNLVEKYLNIDGNSFDLLLDCYAYSDEK